MSITVGYNPRPLAEVQNIRVNGLSCVGCYCIYIGFDTYRSTVEQGQTATLDQLSCSIEMPNHGLLAFGEKTDGPMVEWSQYHNTPHFGFKFILTGNQIEAIEKARSGGDLEFNIWLAGVAKNNTQNTTDSFHDRACFKIKKQEWLEALDNTGYQNTLLFEIVLPGESSVGEKVKSLLSKSQSHILSGHYDESVGACRQVIEIIEEIYGDKRQSEMALNSFAKDRKAMTINERILFFRQSLKHITHLANHPSGDSFSRSQAKAILGAVVALLSAYEPMSSA